MSKRAAKKMKRSRGGRRWRPVGKRSAAGGSSKVTDLLKTLAELIRAQQAEIDQLKREGERFAAIRRLVAA